MSAFDPKRTCPFWVLDLGPTRFRCPRRNNSTALAMCRAWFFVRRRTMNNRNVYKAVSRRVVLAAMLAASTMWSAVFVETAQAQQRPAAPTAQRPNILVIFGDDIGMWNVGAYTNGMMGRTPNIDRIAREGILFTDHYGQPSCTAGRAAFIMGQLPIRTGMTTVGNAGSTQC